MLLIDRDGPIHRITLNRPEVRNAFNDELVGALADALAEGGRDEKTRFIVLAGAGKLFCAGADLNWMMKAAGYGAEENRRDALRMSELFQGMIECPKPIIARVHGAALGGATGLIAACDIVVAEEGTVFAFSEVKLGILPAVISPHVIRRIGPVHARHWFMTGGRFDAAEAFRIQLVDRVAPTGRLDETMDALVNELLSSAPYAMSQAKGLVGMVATAPVRDVRDDVVDLIARLRAGDEAKEGMSAFLERRSPNWVGSQGEGGE